jgi:lysophospholipase L1-like esterase
MATPATDTYTAVAVATAYTLTGPSGGSVGSPSTDFTITITGGTTGSTIFTPSDSGDGGTFTPTTVTIAAGVNGTGTFTYTPATAGAKSISTSDNGGLTDPAPIAYTASTGPTTVPVTDSNLLWSPGSWDDIQVCTYSVSTRSRQTANTGSYLKFSVTGSTDVSLLIDASISTSITAGNRPSITYSVDSGARTTVQIAAQTEIALLTGQSSATRTFEIWMMAVENSGGTRYSNTPSTSLTNGIRIQGVYINAGAAIAAFPRIKAKKMIMWGDSLVEGVYAGTGWANMVANISNNDPLSASTPVIGEGLAAEFGQIGFGGQGWTTAGSGSDVFGTTWNKFSIDRSRTMTGFDYAICMHGTNDGTSSSAVATASEAWLIAARAALGTSCWIFLVIPPGGYVSTGLTNGFNAYIAAHGSDTKTKLLDMSGTISKDWFDNGGANIQSVDGLHPTATGNSLIAGAVVNLINAQVGGTVTTGGEYSSAYFG